MNKIDVQKESDLWFREVALCREETAIERSRAGALDSRQHVGSIVRSEGANFQPAPIPERLDHRILGQLHMNGPAVTGRLVNFGSGATILSREIADRRRA
jgi:hypothetical protein